MVSPLPGAALEEPSRARAGARIFSSPLARRLAREAGLTIADIRGTGPGGRVVRRDVQQALEARQPGQIVGARAPGAAYVDLPHPPVRTAHAAAVTQSRADVPHLFLRGTARVDRLLRMRAHLNRSTAVRVSVTDLVVMAASRAHALVPEMNVIWRSDAVRRFSGVDISLAVPTDEGMVATVLRGADQMRLSAIAAASRDLVERARSGRLREDELDGGTLTITNLGGFAIDDLAGFVNPAQSAVLAVGSAREAPLVTKKGRLRIGTVIGFTLAVDGRLIDAAVAALWMSTFVSLLEEPVQILA
jgi:pyruvate dehydrogenase E2 component (dihydrolipoamide acetyltransferase)